MMRKLLFLAMLSALFLGPALADRPIDETVAADPDGEVSIELVAGSVHVIGWDRAEVQVTGTVGDDVEKVDISSSGGDVSIEVELPDHGGYDGEDRSLDDAAADLEIRVPDGCLVEVESVSASITVEDFGGAVDLESVSGKVSITGAPRQAEVSTVSGRIVVSSDAPLDEGDFESVSGSIEVRTALGSGGDFSFETVSGNIELRLPGNTSADFEIETFSGEIVNELGPEAKRTSQYAPGKTLEFTTGGGDADVEIESFSGKIELLID
jgi:hypothetical protein